MFLWSHTERTFELCEQYSYTQENKNENNLQPMVDSDFKVIIKLLSLKILICNALQILEIFSNIN